MSKGGGGGGQADEGGEVEEGGNLLQRQDRQAGQTHLKKDVSKTKLKLELNKENWASINCELSGNCSSCKF